MNAFHYTEGRLFCEQVPVDLLAERFGTPLYVYSKNHFVAQARAIRKAFAEVQPLVCYSIKANSNLGLLRAMAKDGCGFDAVSRGEIFRALRAGADPATIVFAGVGKRDDEIAYALEQGILMFNVESEAELSAIDRVAVRLNKKARVALRINPDVDPKTHVYISTGKRENKFGIDIERARGCLAVIKASKHMELKGLHIHIGSQITQADRHAEAIDKIAPFVAEICTQGFPLEYLNVGGGFGISYKGDEGLPVEDFAAQMVPRIRATGLKMVCEPGRFISGNGGVLLTKVVYDKPSGDKHFLIVDGAMNDLLRPSIYDAWHTIWPVQSETGPWTPAEGLRKCDVVGPICESGDFFAKDRELPAVREGDLLAVFSAGAYGFTMAGNYNTRPRPAEILVDGDSYWVARERETLEDLLRGEHVEPGEVFRSSAS